MYYTNIKVEIFYDKTLKADIFKLIKKDEFGGEKSIQVELSEVTNKIDLYQKSKQNE